MATNCGRCHTCGGPVREVLDGEEWCERCGYQRPAAHGWAKAHGELTPCPELEVLVSIKIAEQKAHMPR